MKISQKRAIWYAFQKRKNAELTKLIIKNEGTLNAFENSNYATLTWYCKSKGYII